MSIVMFMFTVVTTVAATIMTMMMVSVSVVHLLSALQVWQSDR